MKLCPGIFALCILFLIGLGACSNTVTVIPAKSVVDTVYVNPTARDPRDTGYDGLSRDRPVSTLNYAYYLINAAAESGNESPIRRIVITGGNPDADREYAIAKEFNLDRSTTGNALFNFGPSDQELTVVGEGARVILLNTERESSAAGRRVVNINKGARIRFENIRITGGNIHGASRSTSNGGGIYVDQGGSLVLGQDCVVDGNRATGFGNGVYVDRGTLTLTDNAYLDTSDPAYPNDIFLGEGDQLHLMGALKGVVPTALITMTGNESRYILSGSLAALTSNDIPNYERFRVRTLNTFGDILGEYGYGVPGKTSAVDERGRLDTGVVELSYYVHSFQGSDSNDGLTPGTAFETLPYAVSRLNPEIRRIEVLYETVLAGEIELWNPAGREITIAGTTGSAISITVAESAQSRAFSLRNGTKALFENITISGGRPQGDKGYGGAFYVDGTSVLTLGKGMVITGNEAALISENLHGGNGVYVDTGGRLALVGSVRFNIVDTAIHKSDDIYMRHNTPILILGPLRGAAPVGVISVEVEKRQLALIGDLASLETTTGYANYEKFRVYAPGDPDMRINEEGYTVPGIGVDPPHIIVETPVPDNTDTAWLYGTVNELFDRTVRLRLHALTFSSEGTVDAASWLTINGTDLGAYFTGYSAQAVPAAWDGEELLADLRIRGVAARVVTPDKGVIRLRAPARDLLTNESRLPFDITADHYLGLELKTAGGDASIVDNGGIALMKGVKDVGVKPNTFDVRLREDAFERVNTVLEDSWFPASLLPSGVTLGAVIDSADNHLLHLTPFGVPDGGPYPAEVRLRIPGTALRYGLQDIDVSGSITFDILPGPLQDLVINSRIDFYALENQTAHGKIRLDLTDYAGIETFDLEKLASPLIPTAWVEGALAPISLTVVPQSAGLRTVTLAASWRVGALPSDGLPQAVTIKIPPAYVTHATSPIPSLFTFVIESAPVPTLLPSDILRGMKGQVLRWNVTLDLGGDVFTDHTALTLSGVKSWFKDLPPLMEVLELTGHTDSQVYLVLGSAAPYPNTLGSADVGVEMGYAEIPSSVLSKSTTGAIRTASKFRFSVIDSHIAASPSLIRAITGTGPDDDGRGSLPAYGHAPIPISVAMTLPPGEVNTAFLNTYLLSPAAAAPWFRSRDNPPSTGSPGDGLPGNAAVREISYDSGTTTLVIKVGPSSGETYTEVDPADPASARFLYLPPGLFNHAQTPVLAATDLPDFRIDFDIGERRTASLDKPAVVSGINQDFEFEKRIRINAVAGGFDNTNGALNVGADLAGWFTPALHAGVLAKSGGLESADVLKLVIYGKSTAPTPSELRSVITIPRDNLGTDWALPVAEQLSVIIGSARSEGIEYLGGRDALYGVPGQALITGFKFTVSGDWFDPPPGESIDSAAVSLFLNPPGGMSLIPALAPLSVSVTMDSAAEPSWFIVNLSGFPGAAYPRSPVNIKIPERFLHYSSQDVNTSVVVDITEGTAETAGPVAGGFPVAAGLVGVVDGALAGGDATTITVTLSGDFFLDAGSNKLPPDSYPPTCTSPVPGTGPEWISNKPAGVVESAFTRIDSTTVKITLTGTPGAGAGDPIRVRVPGEALVKHDTVIEATQTANGIWAINGVWADFAAVGSSPDIKLAQGTASLRYSAGDALRAGTTVTLRLNGDTFVPAGVTGDLRSWFYGDSAFPYAVSASASGNLLVMTITGTATVPLTCGYKIRIPPAAMAVPRTTFLSSSGAFTLAVGGAAAIAMSPGLIPPLPHDQGVVINPGAASLTLSVQNDSFNGAALPPGTDVTAWFVTTSLASNIPAGLTAKVVSVNPGVLVIGITGTPDAGQTAGASAKELTIRVPKNALTDSFYDTANPSAPSNYLTVTANPGTKWNINRKQTIQVDSTRDLTAALKTIYDIQGPSGTDRRPSIYTLNLSGASNANANTASFALYHTLNYFSSGNSASITVSGNGTVTFINKANGDGAAGKGSLLTIAKTHVDVTLAGSAVLQSPDTTAAAPKGLLHVKADAGPDGARLVLQGGTVSRNYAQSGGGIYVEAGTLVMTGGTVSGNKAATGGGIYVATGAALTMTGGTINGNTSTGNGGGVAFFGSSFLIDGAAVLVQNNAASDNGGGVYLGGGTLDLSDGIIGGSGDSANNNTAQKGAGVAVTGSAVFRHTGGTLRWNKAAEFGGALYLNTTSVTNSIGGTASITGNYAGAAGASPVGRGGALHINAGKLTMTGGTIGGNTAAGSGTAFGGGVYVTGAGCEFVFEGGVIGGTTGNTAKTGGGGIYVTDAGVATMKGGEIKNNIVSTKNVAGGAGGGGVYADGTGVFALTGGSIGTNKIINSLTDPSAGIYQNGVTKFSLSAQIDADNDVYINAGKPLSVVGGNAALAGGGLIFDNTGSTAGFARGTMIRAKLNLAESFFDLATADGSTWKSAQPVLNGDSFAAGTIPNYQRFSVANHVDVHFSASASGYVTVNTAGTAYEVRSDGLLHFREPGVIAGTAPGFYVKTGGNDASDGLTAETAFATLKRALAAAEHHSTKRVNVAGVLRPAATAGANGAANDIFGPLPTGTALTIASASSFLISAAPKSPVTISGVDTTAALSRVTSANVRVLCVTAAADLTFTGISITDGTLRPAAAAGNNGFGAGLYVDHGGASITLGATAVIHSNSISPTAEILVGGGGVFLNAGTISVRTGSSIQDNTVSSGNAAKVYGGGAYLAGGTFLIDGGALSNNRIASTNASASAAAYGGALYLASPALSRMTSGSIFSNKATAINDSRGGAVYIAPGGAFSMADGTVYNNSLASSISRGTGVYVGGTFSLYVGSGANSFKGSVSTGNDVFTEAYRSAAAPGTRVTLAANIDVSFTPVNPAILITPEFYNAGSPVLAGSSYISASRTRVKITPQFGNTSWYVAADGTLNTTP